MTIEPRRSGQNNTGKHTDLEARFNAVLFEIEKFRLKVYLAVDRRAVHFGESVDFVVQFLYDRVKVRCQINCEFAIAAVKRRYFASFTTCNADEAASA